MAVSLLYSPIVPFVCPRGPAPCRWALALTPLVKGTPLLRRSALRLFLFQNLVFPLTELRLLEELRR